MQIILKQFNGTHIVCDADVNETVQQLKWRVGRIISAKVDGLIFAGINLENNMTLGTYDIPPDSVIQIITNLTSGPQQYDDDRKFVLVLNFKSDQPDQSDQFTCYIKSNGKETVNQLKGRIAQEFECKVVSLTWTQPTDKGPTAAMCDLGVDFCGSCLCCNSFDVTVDHLQEKEFKSVLNQFRFVSNRVRDDQVSKSGEDKKELQQKLKEKEDEITSLKIKILELEEKMQNDQK